jgi:hypothetical protein
MKKNEIKVLAWPYNESKTILKWIGQNQYIPLYVFPYSPGNGYFLGNSFYIGDRTKSLEENIAYNLIKFGDFVDETNLKSGGKKLYVLYFKSLLDMGLIEKEFLNRAVNHGGEYLLLPEDAIIFVERCKELKLKILALEAFHLYSDGRIQPDMGADMYYDDTYFSEIDDEIYFVKYHIKKNADIGHWEEAKQFIKEKINSNYYFEVYYQD